MWLWQSGYVLVWAIAAAILGLLAWPLARLVRRRANAEARLILGEAADPSGDWNIHEQEAWAAVVAMADSTVPFSVREITEIDPLLARSHQVIETVARRLHPNASRPWAEFSVPELLLLVERVARELRTDVLRTTPLLRSVHVSRFLWLREQYETYEPLGTAGYSLWRLARLWWNPMVAIGRETNRILEDKFFATLFDRLRARLTQAFILKVGRAAIDLYAGRLALSDEEMRVAREVDAPATKIPAQPVRLILVGQVNAGKSSLVNALAQETHCAVGPVPTTSQAMEYRLELEGRPAVSLVDMPGLTEAAAPEFLAQAERADLVVWVASAPQPARSPDRQGLDAYRFWATQLAARPIRLARRPPPVLLALTHVDELRPANEWAPPYDVATPSGPKASNIRAAIDAVARALEVPAESIVPVAMPPGLEPYNIDALWARISVELPEAKLAQLDRLRVGSQRSSLRNLVRDISRTGRTVIQTVAAANQDT